MKRPAQPEAAYIGALPVRERRRKHLPLVLLLLATLGVLYVAAAPASEPFFNNDETRHVMTGVYFRDALRDLPATHLRDYTTNYYLQYPALGLLVWPPFFYVVEGLAMSVGGTSLVVSKTLIALFAALGCVYLFRLVRRTHDAARAAVAVLVFGLAPLVFTLSHYVMLEVPTLALGLVATFYFIRYLDAPRRRALALAALAAALAALTRFDAIYLLPFFAALLFIKGRVNLLGRKEVLVAAASALVLVAPAYALSASGIGWMHFKFATETVSPDDPGFLSLQRLIFYPSRLPAQLGWFAFVPALIGLVAACGSARRRRAAWPYLALVAAVYMTFTPLGELESRHAIYWLPAFACFAADGLCFIAAKLRAPQVYLPLAGLVLVGLAWTTLAAPRPYVRGYAEAARSVADESNASPFCLFVGKLNGNFIYQLRRADPARKLWVLRADKILYSVLIVPGMEQRQYAANETEMLAAIYKYDPGFLILEQPQSLAHTSKDEGLGSDFEEQVRAVVRNHPERFKLEKEIAVESNHPDYTGMRLQLFRNVYRNEQPEHKLDLPILMLRQSLQTTVPE